MRSSAQQTRISANDAQIRHPYRKHTDIEALRTGQGFRIPSPPQKVGDMLVAEAYAVDLLRLPPPAPDGLVLINRVDESARPITARKAAQIIREAQEEGRPIYLVLG